MNKSIKIQKPKFIDELEEITDFYEEVVISDKIQNKIVSNELLETKEEVGITIDSCVFNNVVFDNCTFKNIDLIDSRFENCDLANVDFNNGSIQRTEFINCKLLGAKFDDANLKDMLFKDCVGRYSNFSFSKLNSVHINHCDFEEGIFQEVNLNKTIFEKTSLINTFFNKTSLRNTDFTTCEIAGISVEINDIKGAIVTSIQGLDLTRLLEISIR